MLAARQGHAAALQYGLTCLPARMRHVPTCATAKPVSLVKLQVRLPGFCFELIIVYRAWGFSKTDFEDGNSLHIYACFW